MYVYALRNIYPLMHMNALHNIYSLMHTYIFTHTHACITFLFTSHIEQEYKSIRQAVSASPIKLAAKCTTKRAREGSRNQVEEKKIPHKNKYRVKLRFPFINKPLQNALDVLIDSHWNHDSKSKKLSMYKYTESG